MKSFRSGTCARTLLPTIETGPPSVTGEALGRLPAEEGHERRHTALLRVLGDIGRRVDAEERDARSDEVLEEVAVVRRELDDEIVLAQREPLTDHLDVVARVLDPRRRVGRVVGVVGEDVLRLRRTPRAERGSSARRRRREAGRTAPSPGSRPAGRKLWHGGDMPRSTTRQAQRSAAEAARRYLRSPRTPSCSRHARVVPDLPRCTIRRPHRLEVHAIAECVHRVPEPVVLVRGKLPVARELPQRLLPPKRCRRRRCSRSQRARARRIRR